MKRSTMLPLTVLLVALTLGGIYGWQAAEGQTRTIQPAAADAYSQNFAVAQNANGTTASRSRYSVRLSQRAKLLKAVKALQSAKDDKAKDKAKSDLTKVLNTVFDADLKQRQEEIAKIEARIKKLKATLDKRRTARDRIIDLQIKVLVNEADGLGFPSRTGSRTIFPEMYSYPPFRNSYGSGAFGSTSRSR